MNKMWALPSVLLCCCQRCSIFVSHECTSAHERWVKQQYHPVALCCTAAQRQRRRRMEGRNSTLNWTKILPSYQILFIFSFIQFSKLIVIRRDFKFCMVNREKRVLCDIEKEKRKKVFHNNLTSLKRVFVIRKV